MRVCLIVNPRAGARPEAALEQIQQSLAGWCERLDVRLTDSAGAAERIAKSLDPGEWDRCVAVGGDGTINEVVNGLPDGLPLAIIPMGTANVLARELRLPLNDPVAACEVLRECEPQPMDLGWCNGRRFCLMAGIGFDAAAVRDVVPNIKDLLGAPAYVLSGLKALAEMPGPIRYRLTLPDRQVVARGMMLVVANAAGYAGPLQLAPMARLDSGCLDVCLFVDKSRLGFLGQLWNVLQHRQMEDPQFKYFHATELTVATSPSAAVQLDGDYFCRTPVTLRVLPGAVQVVRPATAPDAAAVAA